MKILTKELRRNLPALRETEGQGMEATAQVKFFCPWNSWNFYGVEYDPDQKLFYGLVDGFEKELGYFSLEELESIKGPLGLKMERDLYFDPTPLNQIKGAVNA